MPNDPVSLLSFQECYDPETGAWSAPHIPRGDLQTTFAFKGFDDVRRLGLQRATEAAVRGACKSADTGERSAKVESERKGMVIACGYLLFVFTNQVTSMHAMATRCVSCPALYRVWTLYSGATI